MDQVSVRDRNDLRALRSLDQKLWVALAMPIKEIDIDGETLALIDDDHDGRIHVEDILRAIDWADEVFVDLDRLLTSSDEVPLDAFKDQRVVAAARRMLADLGKKDRKAIGITDVEAITKAFADTVLNGDGIVITLATDHPELRRLIEDVIATAGPVTDRSGKPGVDAEHAARFFADVDKRATWLARGKDPGMAPLGEATASAHAALAAVRAKLDDFFTRCRVAAYDARGAAALGGPDADLAALADRALTASDAGLERLPLARIDAAGRLPLAAGLNPAWAARIAAFVRDTVTPVLGARDALTESDLATIVERLAPHAAWIADKPTTIVDGLDAAWVEQLAEPGRRQQLAELIAADAALTDEYAQISAVSKAVRMQRDFGRILRNFVNFSDFYSRQDGVFQAGTLYLDGRTMHLCVAVADPGRHVALASASDACLLYCDVRRDGQSKQIVAALTNGDTDAIGVGRNGVFYDRDGKPWDATISKVIDNPISVREAFWQPYKKLIKIIEDNVQKRAQAAQAEASSKLEAAGTAVAHADKLGKPAGAAPAEGKPPEPKKLDLGTIAAIGVAIGGIGTLFGVVMSVLFGMGVWVPLGFAGILLMISGPWMVLAWLKLRRRNLGPILDANGWAINGRVRINVAFGAAMTELARLPKGAKRSTRDPFADKRRPWRLYVTTAAIITLGGAWYFGKLDSYLPVVARSTSVLGAYAPAAVPPSESAAKR